jgi:hypothetical protein
LVLDLPAIAVTISSSPTRVLERDADLLHRDILQTPKRDGAGTSTLPGLRLNQVIRLISHSMYIDTGYGKFHTAIVVIARTAFSKLHNLGLIQGVGLVSTVLCTHEGGDEGGHGPQNQP